MCKDISIPRIRKIRTLLSYINQFSLTDRVKLEAIKQHVDERTLDMEVIVNPKSLEGAHQGVNVIQLETAVGAAMKVYILQIH